jgi:adenosylcobyric acid synthase
VLMVQGTASSAGKSLLVTALCRILRQDGLRVAPFKAQNMSNNSFATPDGLELGRAQAVQAEAAGIPPRIEMNPILLKPEAQHRSQMVVLGRPRGTIGGGDYISRKVELWPVVTAALDRLRAEYDAVVIEGAGSPAEINLRAGDIVNMRVARYAAAPVLLAGDIDRGGVFAHLVGTLQLLQPEERALVRGMVINKFRGSPELLRPGVDWLEQYTGIPVAGVVPWLEEAGIADEDAVALEQAVAPAPAAPNAITVVVPRLPHVANFDDLDPLATEPGVSVRWIDRAAQFGAPDLVVLPGSKATIADLAWLRAVGLAEMIEQQARRGGGVIGLCGGLQMLGSALHDPEHVESEAATVAGLDLLPVETWFAAEKATHQVQARLLSARGLFAGGDLLDINGYEIHMGRTETRQPALRISERSGVVCDVADGAASADGMIQGTYLHGLFDNDALRALLLANLALAKGVAREGTGAPWSREAAYDRLAAHVRAALDMKLVRRLLAESVA